MCRSWRQYKALLTKMAWYSRKRRPAVMLLEVLWPILLFTIVIIVRQGSLPDRRAECYYAPRSMPSTGALKFLQSHICTVNNKCLRHELYRHKGKPAGTGGADNRPMPHEQVPTIQGFTEGGMTEDILPLVPKVIKLIENLQSTVSDPDVGEYLSEGGFRVQHFVQNDTKIKQFLVDQSIVPPGLVDQLFEAEIRTGSSQGNSIKGGPAPTIFDLKKVICDPDQLKNIIHLPDGFTRQIGLVSRELCNSSHTTLANFAGLVTKELKTDSLTDDVLQSIGSLTTYTPDRAVNDLAVVTDAVTSSRTLSNLTKVLPIIGNIGSITRNIKDIIMTAPKSGKFSEVVDLVVPLIGNLLNDHPFAASVGCTAKGIEGIVSFIRKATGKSTFQLVDALGTERAFFQAEVNKLSGAVTSLINLALRSEISYTRLQSMSDRLRMGISSWYDLTCTSADNLTTIFRSKNPDLDHLRSIICSQNRVVATNTFSPLLFYPRMRSTIDNIQRSRVVGTLDIFEILQDVASTSVCTIRIAGKVTQIVRNWHNITSNLGGRIRDALSIEFVTREGAHYGAVEILELISNLIGKTEEFSALSDAIHLAMQILITAENDFVEIREVIKDPGALAAVLLGNDLTETLVNRFLGSKLDLAGLLSLGGDDGQVAGSLCSGGKLLSTLGLLNIGPTDDFNKIQEVLCSTTDLGNVVDLAKVVSAQIGQTIPAYMLHGDWWLETLNDVDGVMNGIGALVDLAAGRKFFDVRVLLKVLYHLIDSLGAGGRADMNKEALSLFGLIQDQIVEPPYFSQDLYDISVALLSTSIFQSSAEIKANLVDYTKNPTLVSRFLSNQGEISSLVTHLLLRSDFKFSLSYNIKDIKFSGEQQLCGPLLIKSFLKFNNASDSDLASFAQALCNMPPYKLKTLVQTVVPSLNMKDLVKNLLNLSPTYLLTSSNLTQEETKRFVEQIKPLGNQFSSLITSVKDIAPGGNATHSSTASMLQSYGSKVCGDEAAFSFGNYGASFLSADQAEEDEKERMETRPVEVEEPKFSPTQLKELEELKDPMCKDLYKGINRIPGIGPVLWRFIKPMTRGKVLYSPNTTTTTRIMREAHWLFDSIGPIKDVAEMWVKFAENGPGQPQNSGGVNRVDIVKVLRNPLVSATVQQTTGVSGEQIARDLEDTGGISAADFASVTSVAKTVSNLTKCLDYGLEGYMTEIDMRDRADYLAAEDRLFAAVEFKKMSEQKMDDLGRLVEDLDIPKHVEYVLRLSIDRVVIPGGLFTKVRQAGPEDDFLDKLRYFWGFVMMQDLVDHSIIKLQMESHNATANLPKIHTQAFPYPCYDQDDFMVWSSFVVVIILLFSWLCMMAVGITNAVSEKESGIEDTMMVMGMKSSVNRVAWFTNTLLGMIVLSAFVTLLVWGGSLIRHSDPLLIFIWLSSYSVAIVMLCYLVSALVHRTNLASLSGLLVYLMLCIPFIILHSKNVVFYLTFNYKVLMSLSVTSAFCFGANELIVIEKNGLGITWDRAFVPIGANFPFAWSCIMILVDSGIYFLIAWFISNKFPGAHGIVQPWYFPLSPYYWGCKRRQKSVYDPASRYRTSATSDDESLSQNGRRESRGQVIHRTRIGNSVVPGEEEPRDLPVGISIVGMSKVYNEKMKSCFGNLYQRLTGKKRLLAVDNLSVNFYEGQITAFLGHNGAGKSTCIHMLTGLITPTGGTAYIGGYNTNEGFEEIRKSLGYCPQHDVLFDYMTIKEHFMFYAQIKGHGNHQDAEDEVQEMLMLTGLHKFRNISVSQLSGGQRRRVSVGNAFIGGSKVIILDEPTSGVDPSARRQIWEIIAKHKKGRTILLCTHHLDEADVLGDRIVILHQGKLICHGTSLWLKTQYGSGYHLTISKRTSKGNVKGEREQLAPSNRPGTGTWSSKRVIEFVRDFVPEAQIAEEIGTEVTIVLPRNRTQTRFEQLFLKLEARARDLHIDKYGVADSTLEEVFLKVTRLAEEGKSLDPRRVKKSVMRRNRHHNSTSSLDSGNSETYDNLAFEDSDIGTPSSLNTDDLSIGTPTSSDRLSSNGTGVRGSRIGSSGYTSPTLSKGDSDGYSTYSSGSEKGSIQKEKLVDAINGKLGGKRRSTGSALKWRQFKALFLKRFHHHRRDLRSHISQIVLPSLFVLLAMVATWFKPSAGRFIPFRLDPSMYGPNQTMFFSTYNSSPLAEEMLETLRTSPGLGTVCMPLEPLNPYQWPSLRRNCSTDDQQYTQEELSPEELALFERYPNCSCAKGTWQCPKEAAGPPRPTLRTHSHDNVVNLTNYPKGVEQYLLRTFDVFKSSEPGGVFGGWTFDNEGSKTAATIWYNNKGSHALPAFYNALNNMALRANMKNATNITDDEYGITVHNQPYNQSAWPISSEGLLMSFSDTGVSLTIMIAYCFVPASFIMYVINERIRQEKRLQFITGVGIALYWCSALLWDMLTYALTVLLTCLIAMAFGLQVYTYGENLQALGAMLMLFGWATTPLMYLLSRWFTSPSVGYVAAFIINLCIGINTTASIYFISTPIFNDRAEILLARKILTNGLLIFPQFCLGDSLVKLAYNQIITNIMSVFHVDSYTSPFSPDLLFYHFLTLGLEGAVFFIIHLVVEINLCDSRRKVQRRANHKEDSDVSRERTRVNTGGADDDLLLIYKLSKLYQRPGGQKTLAVDNLCIGVPRAECFGLLGINGAGKTTSFKMITGEIQPSSGAAMLNHKIISEDASNFDQNVGYCPQYDALDDFLTGEEMIYFYSRLRGILESEISGVCATVVKKFKLEKHIKKRVGAYSAGNKRKLSTALALLGDPELVLLDEPTTGMDPGTRRLVWNNIIDVIKDKRSVILTSHSMEECDALCTRMAIMVNGTFQCMGSSQHLKNKFGDGYTITMRVGGTENDVRRVIHFMKSRFRGAWVKDQHLNMLEFGLNSRSTTLAAMFRRLEREKKTLKIENYSVSQTTLENVFLFFARKQGDMTWTDDDRMDNVSNVYDMEAEFESEGNPSREPSMVGSIAGSRGGSISDAPPSYHSRAIAPNRYDNRHMSQTLDHVSQIHVGAEGNSSGSGSLRTPSSGSRDGDDDDDDLANSVMEGTGSSTDTGELGGIDTSSSSSRQHSTRGSIV